MGSKKSQTTTTETKNEPWSAAKPYLTDLYAAGQNAFNATNNKPFTGELYAAPTAAQLSAVDAYKAMAADPRVNAGQQMGWDGARAVYDMAQKTLAGGFMSPDSNPYLKGAVEAALRPIEQNLTRNILPSIQDQSIAQGAYGGSGYGTAQALAMSDWQQQSADIASKIYAQNYAQERAYQQQAASQIAAALGLQEGGTNAGLAGANLLGQAGSQEQAWQQAALDAALAKYQLNQQAAWAGIPEMASLLTAGGYNQSSGTQTTTVKTGATENILKGLAGAAGLAGSLMTGGLGAGLMGGLSGLFGGSALANSAASLASRSALGGLAGDMFFGRA